MIYTARIKSKPMYKASVIIPTRNRAIILKKALSSITRQTLAQKEFELIIIDNGSTDNTKEIVDSFSGKIDNLVYIYDDSPGLHVGRHMGLIASNSDILVYGDDDIETFPTWLESVLETFEDDDVVLVGGKNLPNFESTPPDWISKMWEKEEGRKILGYLSILDFGDEKKEINPGFVFGCNFSIRKKILLEAEGFHPDGMPQELIRYRGDGESYVSRYILKKGYKTIYNPKASVYHLVSNERITKEYFAKRSYNQGISDSYTHIREDVKVNILKKRIKYILKKYILKRDMAIEGSYLEGYMYHQNEVRRDNALMSWVKRDNYIDNGRIR